MARKLRIEYPGAIYHVMNRGDRRDAIFHDDRIGSAVGVMAYSASDAHRFDQEIRQKLIESRAVKNRLSPSPSACGINPHLQPSHA